MAEPRLITAAEAALDDLGDVKGPGPVTDGNIALFDGTSGTLLKAAGVVEGVATIDSTTNVLIGDGTGNAIDSGSAIGDLGSLLTINTARVDASGSDETGTIGNLSKPFLTVQSAIDHIFALGGFDPGVLYMIDIGNNKFIDENLTIDDPIYLGFRGANLITSIPWSNLTLTADATIYVEDCMLNGSTITTSDNLRLVLTDVDMDNVSIVSTAGNDKHLSIISETRTAYRAGTITADDIGNIELIGISADLSGGNTSISVANSDVSIRIQDSNGWNDTNLGDDLALFDIVCGGTSTQVTVINSIVGDVTANFVFFTNSKSLGTVTASTAFSPAFINDQGPYAYDYDFARDGGAQGTIALTASNGSKGTGLPTGFVITGAFVEIVTPLDSASHTATAALTSGEAANDIQTAIIVSNTVWTTVTTTRKSVVIKTTTDRTPSLVIAVQDLTAGKFTLHIDGYVS